MIFNYYRGFPYKTTKEDKVIAFKQIVDLYYETTLNTKTSSDFFENEEEIIAQAVLTPILTDYDIVRNDLGPGDNCIDLIAMPIGTNHGKLPGKTFIFSGKISF